MGGCASVSRQNRLRMSTDGLRGRIQPCSFSGPLTGGGGGAGGGRGGAMDGQRRPLTGDSPCRSVVSISLGNTEAFDP